MDGVRNWAEVLELLTVAEVPSLLLIVHTEAYICKTLYHMYGMETNKPVKIWLLQSPHVIKAFTGAISQFPATLYGNCMRT